MLELKPNEVRDRYGLTEPWRAIGEVYTFTRSPLLVEIEIRDILDVGTGKGYFVSECVERGFNAYGIDTRKIFEGDLARFFQADSRKLPFTKESFDLVHTHLFFDDLIHLQENPSSDLEQTLIEIWRVLRPNGILYMGYDDFPHDAAISQGFELIQDGFTFRYYRKKDVELV